MAWLFLTKNAKKEVNGGLAMFKMAQLKTLLDCDEYLWRKVAYRRVDDLRLRYIFYVDGAPRLLQTFVGVRLTQLFS